MINTEERSADLKEESTRRNKTFKTENLHKYLRTGHKAIQVERTKGRNQHGSISSERRSRKLNVSSEKQETVK